MCRSRQEKKNPCNLISVEIIKKKEVRAERESCDGMSVMVTHFSCPHFIPRLWPATLRSPLQYKPDTWNHDTLLFWPSCKSITSPLLQKWNVCGLHVLYIYFSCLRLRCCGWWRKKKKKLRVWWMCSGQRKVGGLYLSALLLQQTAELQANKPHYHHRHQQQISLQQLSAVHITALTAQTCTLLREPRHLNVSH